MCGTDIPMPAVGAAAGVRAGTLTVASFGDCVRVLATKTRPKKLRICGSDGATYTFLLKVRVHFAPRDFTAWYRVEG